MKDLFKMADLFLAELNVRSLLSGKGLMLIFSALFFAVVTLIIPMILPFIAQYGKGYETTMIVLGALSMLTAIALFISTKKVWKDNLIKEKGSVFAGDLSRKFNYVKLRTIANIMEASSPEELNEKLDYYSKILKTWKENRIYPDMNLATIAGYVGKFWAFCSVAGFGFFLKYIFTSSEFFAKNTPVDVFVLLTLFCFLSVAFIFMAKITMYLVKLISIYSEKDENILRVELFLEEVSFLASYSNEDWDDGDLRNDPEIKEKKTTEVSK